MDELCRQAKEQFAPKGSHKDKFLGLAEVHWHDEDGIRAKVTESATASNSDAIKSASVLMSSRQE
jgi:hypothetical protein